MAEQRSANGEEAMGSNSFEVRKIFLRIYLQLLKLQITSATIILHLRFVFPQFTSSSKRFIIKNLVLRAIFITPSSIFLHVRSSEFPKSEKFLLPESGNREKFCSWNLKSLALKSVILPRESGIQVPLTSNPESSTWNAKSTVSNPESWITFWKGRNVPSVLTDKFFLVVWQMVTANPLLSAPLWKKTPPSNKPPFSGEES